MRQADKDEVWSSNHKSPQEAFLDGINNSTICLTIIKDKPVAMFGVAPECALGYKAIIWFLGTDALLDIKKPFLRHSRTFIDMFLKRYKYLYNWVKCDNEIAMKWLRFCGAKFMPPMPFGEENELFQFFCFTRDDDPYKVEL